MRIYNTIHELKSVPVLSFLRKLWEKKIPENPFFQKFKIFFVREKNYIAIFYMKLNI